MMKFVTAFVVAVTFGLGALTPVKAADLDELAKYLGFIEGFQSLFESCQAEATLPAKEISYAREHIAVRRALIFAGLSEDDRNKVSEDAQDKKKQMLDGVAKSIAKSSPKAKMKDLCKQGFFTGVMESEVESEKKEEAAIKEAKS